MRKRYQVTVVLKQAMAFAFLAGSLSVGATCTRPSDFMVDSLALDKASVSKAFTSLGNLAGYKVINKSSSMATITSKDAGGPLDALLEYFGEQTSSTARVDVRNCSITVYDIGQAPKENTYFLKEGEPIHQELVRWAAEDKWKLIWQMPYSWRVFSDATYVDVSALKAIGRVIENLRDEGKPVRMTVFEGNRVIEIVSGELSN